MNNKYIAQLSKNIKFSYKSFDRVILRGYILDSFYEGGVASFLKSIGVVEQPLIKQSWILCLTIL